MNPKEFPWDESQQITVTNPTKSAFPFKVHNKDYVVEAGETVKMPGFMAWVYVYNQAVKAAQADGVFYKWNEEGFRKEYFDKFVAGIDDIVQAIETQPQIQPMAQPVEKPKEVAKATNAGTTKA